jgi:hypothetical protein
MPVYPGAHTGRFPSRENRKIGPIVGYKRIVLLTDESHELPVFGTSETEVVDMIRYVTCAVRSVDERVCKHSSIKSFTVAPQAHGHWAKRKPILAARHGARHRPAAARKGSGHKAERARLSVCPEPDTLPRSPLELLLASTYLRSVRLECVSPPFLRLPASKLLSAS